MRNIVQPITPCVVDRPIFVPLIWLISFTFDYKDHSLDSFIALVLRTAPRASKHGNPDECQHEQQYQHHVQTSAGEVTWLILISSIIAHFAVSSRSLLMPQCAECRKHKPNCQHATYELHQQSQHPAPSAPHSRHTAFTMAVAEGLNSSTTCAGSPRAWSTCWNSAFPLSSYPSAPSAARAFSSGLPPVRGIYPR